MNINKNIILDRTNKKSILIDTFYSESTKDQPIVIFCHGYKGFKDWGAWNMMANSIAKAGFCYVKFNFSHNGGTMENPIDFPNLEAFGNNNYSKELEDLNDVIDWTETYFKNNLYINTDHICLIGHSRGGGIAILKASEDGRIKKLITLASVSDFRIRFGSHADIENWKKNGVKFVLNGRTKQQMPHYYQFFEDFKANEERLDVKSAIKRLTIPMLIIHGDKDTSVSIQEAKNLHQWYPNSSLYIISGADHVFNTKHPWHKNESSNELNTVIKNIIDFTARKKRAS